MAEEKQTILIKNNTAGYLSNGSAPGSLIGIDALPEGEPFSSPVGITIYNSETEQIEVTDPPLSQNKIGSDSIAIGDRCAAPSPNSLSVGVNNLTAGTASVALGHSNKAKGYVSTTLGAHNTATGSYSAVLGGYNSVAEADYSIAIGQGAKARGLRAIALGYMTEATGNSSFAEGQYTIASGEASHAGGIGTKASNTAQCVFGKFNANEPNNEYLFIIGNGTNEENRSNAMTIHKNGDAWFAGNVTIGNENKKLVTDTELQEISNNLKTLKSTVEEIPVIENQIIQTELIAGNWDKDKIYNLGYDEYNITLSYDASRDNDGVAKEAYMEAEISSYGLKNKIIALGDVPLVSIPVIIKKEKVS